MSIFLQYLSQCDCVVYMKDGRIAEMGPHEELVATGTEYSQLYTTYNKEQTGKFSSEQWKVLSCCDTLF